MAIPFIAPPTPDPAFASAVGAGAAAAQPLIQAKTAREEMQARERIAAQEAATQLATTMARLGVEREQLAQQAKLAEMRFQAEAVQREQEVQRQREVDALNKQRLEMEMRWRQTQIDREKAEAERMARGLVASRKYADALKAGMTPQEAAPLLADAWAAWPSLFSASVGAGQYSMPPQEFTLLLETVRDVERRRAKVQGELDKLLAEVPTAAQGPGRFGSGKRAHARYVALTNQVGQLTGQLEGLRTQAKGGAAARPPGQPTLVYNQETGQFEEPPEIEAEIQRLNAETNQPPPQPPGATRSRGPASPPNATR